MLKSLILVGALLISGSAMADWGGGDRSEYIRCESHNYNYNSCSAWNISRVRQARLVEQHSKTYCQRGHNWRPTHRGVEVWGGCRGTFEVRGRR